MKYFYIFIWLIVSVFLIPSSINAITPPTGINIVNFVDRGGDCGQTPNTSTIGGTVGLQVDFKVETDGVTIEGPGQIDVYRVVLHDSNGVLIGIANGVALMTPSFYNNVVIYVNYDGLVFAPTSRPWTASVEDVVYSGNVINSYIPMGTLTFDPADFSPSCASLPFITSATSDALNSGINDLDVQIFNGTDDNGNPTLQIYALNDEGDGTLALEITQDIIAPYIDNPPSENTTLMTSENGKVTLYILDTGELQINSGPDSEGKIHVLIFDGIPPTNIYGYTIDPPLLP